MNLHDLILQNLFGILSSVVAAVLGYLAIRILRKIRDSTERTEVHAETTADAVTQLDRISTGTWQRELETRIAAVAEDKSDALAWRVNLDRHINALDREVRELSRFAQSLSDYAHGATDVPTFTTTVAIPTINPEPDHEPGPDDGPVTEEGVTA